MNNKYTVQKLGHYTILILMNKEHVKTNRDRFACYNDIMFTYLPTVKTQQVIILNENLTGGVIYGSQEYAHVAYRKLVENLTSKYSVKHTGETCNQHGMKKIGFSLSENPQDNNWSILQRL